VTALVIERVVVASKNPDKIVEVEAVLVGAGVVGEIVRGLSWPDIVEDGDTLVENALLKARAVTAATGLATIADDTGLEVDALGGAPGLHTARYAGPDATYGENVSKLLQDLYGVENRAARFVTAVALVTPNGPDRTAEGVLSGSIATKPRGSGGFGYDPIFEVGERTLAEIPATEKNRISHRARALHALLEQLR